MFALVDRLWYVPLNRVKRLGSSEEGGRMRVRRTWLVLVALLSTLTLVAAACGGDEPTTDGATTPPAETERIEVTVYGQGAWTGGVSSLVLPSMQGAQIRFNELNEEEGYPATITFAQADTQGSGDNAPPVAQEAAQDPNTVAIFGPAFSGESQTSGDTYNDNQIPFITASATSVVLTGFDWDYWYRAVGNDDAQGRLAAEWVANVIVPENLYILHDNTTYGKPLAETVEAAAADAGVEILGKTGIAEPAIDTGTTVDFASIISDIQASGATSVFFGGYFVDSGPFLNQASAAGLDITMISGDGSVSGDLVTLAGEEAAEGTYLLAPTNVESDFVARYNEEYGGQALSIPPYVGEGYDVASLIGEGIKQAIEGGATDPVDIRAGIKTYIDSLTADSPFVGVAKDYAFDPETHELVTAADELYWFYQVQGGAVTNLGNAVDVLGG
jgi:branched-chain amino acid transport system substrate-binding protein